MPDQVRHDRKVDFNQPILERPSSYRRGPFSYLTDTNIENTVLDNIRLVLPKSFKQEANLSVKNFSPQNPIVLLSDYWYGYCGHTRRVAGNKNVIN